MKILKGLLQVNPYFRTSAKTLVENPIFDQVRVSLSEKIYPEKKVRLSFDNINCFDYELERDDHFKSARDIRKAILKEVYKIKRLLDE